MVDHPLGELLDADVIYIRLHGMGDQPYLYGDPGLLTALSAKQVRDTRLNGQVIFLEGCYGAQIADAFLEAGALAIVGNSGITWGRRFFLGPAQVVGKTWLKALERGSTLREALNEAMKEVKERWGVQFGLGWKVLIRSVGHE